MLVMACAAIGRHGGGQGSHRGVWCLCLSDLGIELWASVLVKVAGVAGGRRDRTGQLLKCTLICVKATLSTFFTRGEPTRPRR